MSERKLGLGMSDYEKRVEELEYILAGVMQCVDYWLYGDDFELDEVGRAKRMIERVKERLEDGDRRIEALIKVKDGHDPCLDCFMRYSNLPIEEFDHHRLTCGCAVKALYIERLKCALSEEKSRVANLIARNAKLDYDLGCAYQTITKLRGE